LLRERNKVLEEAGSTDLQAYVAALEEDHPGRAGKAIRGIAMYFSFTNQPTLASFLWSIRAEGIAVTRKSFPLRNFRGLDPADLARLETAGITTADQILAAGCTPQARGELAGQSGVSPEAILELVKLSDLSRLGGLKSIRARLYFDAGADTPEKIAQWEPEALRAMLEDFVQRTGFAGLPPLPKEVRNAVSRAREIEKLVRYD
jgi:hypothetical protein